MAQALCGHDLARRVDHGRGGFPLTELPAVTRWCAGAWSPTGRRGMKTVLAAILILVLVGPSLAVNSGEALDDPALETRARAISAELRCLVCQNQSIDQSDADLAHELRLV